MTGVNHDHAVTNIQRVFRGHLARLSFRGIIEAKLLERAQQKEADDRNEAAVVIQAQARGMVERRRRKRKIENDRAVAQAAVSNVGIRGGVHHLALQDDELREEFRKYDVDGNGFIMKDEFKRLYDNLEKFGLEENPKRLNDMLSRYNLLGDDRLSFEEFAILMLKISQR
eukprot:PhM_4_TR1534/c0_g1_i1/m.420